MKSATWVNASRCIGTTSTKVMRDGVVSGIPAFSKNSICSGAIAVIS